jgi:hypothetical protein
MRPVTLLLVAMAAAPAQSSAAVCASFAATNASDLLRGRHLRIADSPWAPFFEVDAAQGAFSGLVDLIAAVAEELGFVQHNERVRTSDARRAASSRSCPQRQLLTCCCCESAGHAGGSPAGEKLRRSSNDAFQFLVHAPSPGRFCRPRRCASHHLTLTQDDFELLPGLSSNGALTGIPPISKMATISAISISVGPYGMR